MDEVVTGSVITIWKLAIAFLGSSVLSTVGVYLLARFTGAFDVYGGERAKVLAQFHSLDKLVEQTRELTTVAEVIKARVADQLWDRQIRWTYKRDTYVATLQSIGKLRAGLGRLMAALQAERQGKNWALEEANTAREITDAANNELLLQFDVAPIVLSPHAYETLRNVLRVFVADDGISEQEVQHRIEAVNRQYDLLVQEAKADLGYIAENGIA